MPGKDGIKPVPMNQKTQLPEDPKPADCKVPMPLARGREKHVLEEENVKEDVSMSRIFVPEEIAVISVAILGLPEDSDDEYDGRSVHNRIPLRVHL